jgi:hypothetical protein
MVFAFRLSREKGFSPPGIQGASKFQKNMALKQVPLTTIDSFEVPDCSILYSINARVASKKASGMGQRLDCPRHDGLHAKHLPRAVI